MPEFAPVVPVKLAHAMRERDLLGNYHLLLAHDVVKHPNAYRDVYNDGTPGCDANYIIMDNSVIELGDAVSVEMLQEACKIVNANVIALPDVLLHSRATYESTINAFENWAGAIDFSQVKPMIIPQGRTFTEWKHNLVDFSNHPISEVCCIGIPRNVKQKLSTSRMTAVFCVHNRFPEADIHFLGFSNSLQDDLYTLQCWPEVMGIDSTVPIRQQTRMSMIQKDPGPRDEWWNYMQDTGTDLLTRGDWRRIAYNLSFVRNLIKHPR